MSNWKLMVVVRSLRCIGRSESLLRQSLQALVLDQTITRQSDSTTGRGTRVASVDRKLHPPLETKA